MNERMVKEDKEKNPSLTFLLPLGKFGTLITPYEFVLNPYFLYFMIRLSPSTSLQEFTEVVDYFWAHGF